MHQQVFVRDCRGLLKLKKKKKTLHTEDKTTVPVSKESIIRTLSWMYLKYAYNFKDFLNLLSKIKPGSLLKIHFCD